MALPVHQQLHWASLLIAQHLSREDSKIWKTKFSCDPKSFWAKIMISNADKKIFVLSNHHVKIVFSLRYCSSQYQLMHDATHFPQLAVPDYAEGASKFLGHPECFFHPALYMWERRRNLLTLTQTPCTLEDRKVAPFVTHWSQSDHNSCQQPPL